jgi:hypothetical protein
MNKITIIASLTIIISTISIAFSAKSNDRAIRQCVTKTHWQESLSHSFRYLPALQNGDRPLLSRDHQEFYRARLLCLVERDSFGSRAGFDRQLELLPRLQLVDEVTPKSNELCLTTIIDSRICVNR